MNSTLLDIAKRLNEHICDAERAFREQQEELELTRFERDMYKEIIVNSQNTSNSNTGSNVVFVAFYSMDNGEGVDTETCVGVFTTKIKALKAILDVCKSNKELSVSGFMINEFPVDKELETGNSIYVVQCDEEAHCEISTTILDVKCDNHIDDYKDCYTVEYIIDKVNYIE